MNTREVKSMRIVHSVGASIISILLCVNGVFIKRSLDKIDELEKSVYSLAQSVAVLNALTENRRHHD